MADPASLLFFTCANAPYHDFAPLYACSVLFCAPGARVEIGVEGAFTFEAVHGGAVDVLWEHFGRDAFSYRSAPWTLPNGAKIVPNTVRFLTPPQVAADYIYIGDIDIIFLDRTFPTAHLNFMAKTGLPYSNSVRPGTKRLSGLHFTKRAAYYPVPETKGLDLTSSNDEEVLYQLVRRKGLPVQDQEWFRPTHGIHMSPNRSIRGEPGVRPGWGVEHHLANYRQFIAFEPMRALRPYLSARVRGYLDQIEQEYGIEAAA